MNKFIQKSIMNKYVYGSITAVAFFGMAFCLAVVLITLIVALFFEIH